MKLWGGRFEKSADKLVDDFNSSIRFDARLYRQDISGSIAHAEMLGRQGIIPKSDSEAIVNALGQILEDIEAGKIRFEADAEDIHTTLEKILTERIGDAGKRLHTGRSRNDQVALDIRMYVKDEIKSVAELLLSVLNILLKLAEQNTGTIMAGYTHLQKAQPITLAHHLMAYANMLERDLSRLGDCYSRADVCPLGSGALAGTTYPLDREFVAQRLGFSAITQNSLDAVSDRDFLIELASGLSIIMMHLSRFCEELILWSSGEFSYVKMDDAYSTGSSIMPQKKNPDVAELIRGKTGRVYGDLMGLLTVMKGLPLAYNKDMQEDKEAIFDAIDTVKLCLEVFGKMLGTLTFNKDVMYKGASGGFANATDAADYMVKKGVPFREAHTAIGKMVLFAEKNNKALDELTLEELKACSDVIEDDFYDAVSLEACVKGRSLTGGPAEDAVKKSIERSRKFIADYRVE